MSQDEAEAPKQRSNPRTETLEIPTPRGTIVCWLPGIEEWDSYLAKLRMGSVPAARRQLVQLCSDMSVDQLKGIFEHYPALPEGIADEMGKLVGDELVEGFFDIVEKDRHILVTVDGTVLRFNAPAQSDYETVEANMRDRSEPPGPTMRAYDANCLDGDVAAFNALLTRYPAISGQIYRALGRLAGKAIKVTVKKGPSSSSAQSATDTSQRTA